MILPRLPGSRARHWRLRPLLRSSGILAFLGAALSASAQSIVTAPPAPSEPPPGLFSSSNGPGSIARTSAPFQWGAVGIRPHAFYRITRGDGIQASRGQQTTTTIQHVSAGLGFDLGRRWSADYTISRILYSSQAFSSELNHDFRLDGQASFTDGTLSFSQAYATSNSPRIETGRQTKEESSSTSVSVDYSLGERTGVSVTGSQNLRYIGGAPNAYEWALLSAFNYQFTRRLNAAAEVGVGYVDVDPGIDMTFVRPQVRVSWRPTGKLGFSVYAGREQRQFRQAGSANLSSPTYGASGSYQPFAATTLTLSAQRGISVSYFADQVNESTSWSLGLNQRLLTVLNFNASASRSNRTYIPSGRSTIVVLREDTAYSYNFRLSTRILRRGSIGVVYQHTRNASDATGFGFSSNQVGLEVGYRY